MISSDKNVLRSSALSARRELSPEQRSAYSRTICLRLHEILAAAQPDCLLAYRPLPNEVDTTPLFQDTATQLYAPVTHHHEHMEWRKICRDTVWHAGVFGVDEPQEGPLWSAASGHTILVCPLVAFDQRGNRLGMGKGCFDFWLAQYRSSIDQVIGLAFSCQQVAEVPAERHDMPMDFIITEKEVTQCLKR
ncbi:5-formyltetrahydrofolate cyclo-ligase [Mariprofundus ferrooxydans]|uniref:5-formyltetrahydrofolate cyclo-ligase n=1 Tax=Mariprofundus ferrooxydans TaxID=314344 RepID=UPI000372653C|nr:5-formyltetrahydrofolate cyclo-ligase [Mariprofundus ferrooxydans]